MFHGGQNKMRLPGTDNAVTSHFGFVLRCEDSSVPGGGGVLPYLDYKAAICLPSTLIRHENGTLILKTLFKAEKFESAGFAF